MLMPSPVHIQNRKSATANAGQLNMKNAAIAPAWKTPKAMLLVQLIFCCGSVMSIRSVVTGDSPGMNRPDRWIITTGSRWAGLRDAGGPAKFADQARSLRLSDTAFAV